MFKKSLKYELKASSRLLVPLFICVLVLAIVLSCSFASIGAITRMGDGDVETEMGGAPDSGTFDDETEETIDKAAIVIATLVTSTLLLLAMAFAILMAVASIAVFVLMIRRFYVSFFTDEGYLTFTLPVTVDCHLGTKAVATVIWSAICNAVILVSTLIFWLGFTVLVPEAFAAPAEVFKEIFSLFGEFFTGSIIFGIINVIVSSIASVLLMYFAISVGCMLTKKHRFIVCALCVILISGGVSQMVNIGTTMVSIPLMSMELTPESLDLIGMANMLVSTILYLLQGVACYFATRWILKNRVNLD
jgi:hypothetical protein